MNPSSDQTPSQEPAPQPPLTPSYVPASRDTSRVMTAVPSPEPHLGWFSRGYVPHWDHPGMMQALTFRLHDSLPRAVVERWKAELGLHLGALASLPASFPIDHPARTRSDSRGEKTHQPAGKDTGALRMDWREVELRKRIARYEDEGHGVCWLRQPQIGALVQQALLHFDGQRYLLLAWCVMPNHVHVLVETKPGFPLPGLLHSWKSYTANEANKLLRRRGEFWQREYVDRYIRHAEHYTQAIRYIEGNPAKAGLVKYPADWPFTSARHRLRTARERRHPAGGVSPKLQSRRQDTGAPRLFSEH